MPQNKSPHECTCHTYSPSPRRWVVQVEWECNWINPYENADGSPRTFATREEAERALAQVGDVYIKSWRDNFGVVEW